MLDEEARRTLEEEAIALVNLSNPMAPFLRQPLHNVVEVRGNERDDAKTMVFMATSCATTSSCQSRYEKQQEQQDYRLHQEDAVRVTRLQQPPSAAKAKAKANGENGGAIHPLLQIKANLIARRDGKLAATARKLRIRASEDGGESENPVKDEEGGAFLSLDVYVNGAANGDSSNDAARAETSDLKLAPNSSRNSSSSLKRNISTNHTDELYAQNPVLSEDQQQLEAMNGNISMKSLLVTLKKRKMNPDTQTENSSEADVAASKLPSFRDVFESPRQPQGSGAAPASSSSSTTTSTTTTTATGVAGTTGVPTTVLSSAEMKCKYRTGKCSNVRALKSCGDYHNLCNYHRLRANANQRKLDRKKKVQRQQTSTTSSAASSPSASSGASPASVAVEVASSSLCAPSSAAAAAALASLPTSLVHAPSASVLAPQHSLQQRYEVPNAATMAPFYASSSSAAGVASLDQNSSSHSLRVKQERDACSY